MIIKIIAKLIIKILISILSMFFTKCKILLCLRVDLFHI